MPNFPNTFDGMQQQYAELFPDDDPGCYGLRLAQQYMDDFTALKAMVGPLRQTIVGLPDLDRLTRDVRVPGGAASMLRVCKLARQIATSDELFPVMQQEHLRATWNVGHILRECRKADTNQAQITGSLQTTWWWT